jgi:hypothetical protein|tara:strand:- start:126 stop:314 length:189 start_codon:yes stop_codon:yes gene_type:complete
LLVDLQTQVDKLVASPEGLVLPTECIDGSAELTGLTGITAYLIADQMGLADQETMMRWRMDI